ncbi:MAG: tetratricopeptide repeat protein [Bryobacteraceae bacterium]
MAVLSSVLCAEDATRPEAAELAPVPLTSWQKLAFDPKTASELQAYLAAKDYTKVETALLARIGTTEHPGLLLETLGGVMFRDKKYLQAAIAFKKAEKEGSLRNGAHFTLAMSYVELKRNDWARAELAHLEREKPTEPLYPYWLARLDYDDQRFGESLAKFTKAIEADPRFVRAYDGLGLVNQALGDLETAERSYLKANRLNREQGSKFAWPALNYGKMLRDNGRYAEARAFLQEALAIDPSLPRAHYELGRLEESLAETDAAIADFRTSSSLDPQDPSPVYALFRLYRNAGERKLAAAMMARFRALTATTNGTR